MNKEKKAKIIKSIRGKTLNREILKPQRKVIVDVSQPVYSHDKQRFFKEAYDEERRQLFFT